MVTVTATIFPAEKLSMGYGDIFENIPNIGLTQAYQKLYQRHADHADIMCFLHDDLTIHEENWEQRIEAEFADRQVAIVGMGGALGIGTADLYRKPYRIEQLIRHDYASNQTDWHIHGAQEKGSRDVAVVDGFCMAIRTNFLRKIKGWSWFPYAFHCYDLAMCLMARRHGLKVRMAGINCTHWGGGTSTKAEYAQWCRDHGKTMEREHQEPHRWMYDEFSDVLPFRVTEP